MRIAIVVALGVMGCSQGDRAAPAGGAGPASSASPATADAAAAAAPPRGPDGLPPGLAPPTGGKLVDHADGPRPTWTYVYRDVTADALAAQVLTAVRGDGWTAVSRHQQAGPMVIAVKDRTTMVILVAPDRTGAVQLTFAQDDASKLLVEPPADYPAGFPFEPFATRAPADPRRPRRITLVYSATVDDIADALGRRTSGWACTGDFASFTVCSKDGVEITFTVNSLSPERTALILDAG